MVNWLYCILIHYVGGGLRQLETKDDVGGGLKQFETDEDEAVDELELLGVD